MFILVNNVFNDNLIHITIRVTEIDKFQRAELFL